jgi:3',5'-cyclic AMP phosphodiesterase CpdA
MTQVSSITNVAAELDLDEIAGDAPTVLRIAVISDIHVLADATDYEHSGNIAAGMPENEPNINPFAGLVEVIRTDPELKADYLVCCGDIADKAHPTALSYGWQKLQSLVPLLGARGLIATAGNHDMDSRHQYNDYDARGQLVDLPDFPLANETLTNQYWAHHFAIVNGGNYRIVVLNSAAYHGQEDKAGEPEYVHGRIAQRTLTRLCRELDNREAPPVNIFVCHHHPTNIPVPVSDSDSTMTGGDKLIAELTEPGRGRWLIVHGHRHVAQVQRPASAAISAAGTVFCAGSFGMLLPSGWPSQNQFYLIEIHCDAQASLGMALAGQFRSWTWTRGKGWEMSGFSEQLPGSGGFGYLGDISQLATEVEALVRATGEAFVRLEEARVTVPGLSYVAPGDWPHLRAELGNRGVGVFIDEDDGEVSFIVKGTST